MKLFLVSLIFFVVFLNLAVGQEESVQHDVTKAELANAAKRLQGTWIFDREKTIEIVVKSKGGTITKEEVEDYFADEPDGGSKFTFKSDNSFLFIFGDDLEDQFKGTWKSKKLIRENQSTILVITVKVEEAQEAHDASITFLGKDHIVTNEEEEGPVAYKRFKKKPD